MTEEEKQAIESLRKNRGVSFAQADIISNLINKQQKEIEELKKENEEQWRKMCKMAIELDNNVISKDKIKEILQIEGNADIETCLKVIVAENNRLEDIEDDRDCNYISKDKIREKIKELEKEIEEKQEHGLDFTLIHEHEIDTNAIIKVLNELLED